LARFLCILFTFALKIF